MTLTIELTPEEEARLTAKARAQGKPAEEFLRGLIAQLPSESSKTPTPRRSLPPPSRTPQERLAAFEAWVNGPHPVPVEAVPIPPEYLRRAYLYADEEEI